MNHIRKESLVPILIAAAFAFTGCKDALVSSGGSRSVTVPFEAVFPTFGGIVQGDTTCAAPYFLNLQEGTGQGTHLGEFSTSMTFCIDPTDIQDDGQLLAGESLPYHSGVGTFTAANGDVLTFTIAGAVLPSDADGYNFEFADPFEFTGGTGRFEGATGGGETDSYVVAGVRTDHVWSGTLTLPRGR